MAAGTTAFADAWRVALAANDGLFPAQPALDEFRLEREVGSGSSIGYRDLIADPLPAEVLPAFFAAEHARCAGQGGLLALSTLFALQPGRALPGCWLLQEFVSLAGRCGFELVGTLDRSPALAEHLGSQLDAGLPALPDGASAAQALGACRADLLAGWAALRVLLLRPVERRWRVLPVQADHFERYAELFAACFPGAASQDIWRWKYAEGQATALWVMEGEQAVAHYGGWLRPVLAQGEPMLALQPVDVMVRPGSRGVLTRSGPMFQAAAAMFEAWVGQGKRCACGHGFPTRRHLQLAEKLGLFIDAGPIEEWEWPLAGLPARRWHLRNRVLEAEQVPDWAEACWPRMRSDFTDVVIAVRDGAWLRRRYLQHPEKRYIYLGVAERFGGRRLGLVVLREAPEGCEIVDLIAARADFPYLLEAARRHARYLGQTRLFIWVTRRHGSLFAASGARRGEVEIRNLLLAHCAPLPPERFYDRWWLTGGDSDFR